MTSFEVIGQKSLTGQITAMEWCPTMDLLALVTADSQLMVHRPAGWQRLFVHTGFDHPITCLAWRPDGQVLAVGHADGSATLFGVEEGEQLGTSRTPSKHGEFSRRRRRGCSKANGLRIRGKLCETHRRKRHGGRR